MNHLWQAEEYHSHSIIQYEAARQLLRNIEFKGKEQILDVGCGDGKITAVIAKLLPAGSALGIDISLEMIDFAKKSFPKSNYRNLNFSVQDAQKLDYNEQFDVIFSSFALQWVPNQSAFLVGAYKSLKPCSCLAVTIPLGISEALEEAVEMVIAMPKWSPYFQNFSQAWHFASSNEFAHLLYMHNFALSQCDVINQNTFFSSLDNLKKYIHQWFPYLRYLPEPQKQPFFNEVMDRYIEMEPVESDGKIRFNFSRMDIIAHKLIL